MNFMALLQQNRLVVLMACAAAATLIFISESSYWRSANTLDKLGGVAQARTDIQALERGLLNAETGQRGYLLTQREEYLRPYKRELVKIDQALNSLEAHFSSDPQQAPAMRQLRSLTEGRLSEMALTINLHDTGRRQASIDLVMSNIGRDQMEALRVLSADLLARESVKVTQGRSDVYQVLMVGRIGVAVVAVTSLLALFLYLSQAAAAQQQQRALKEELQAERDRLELQVARRTAELTELTHHLQTAREDERSRLARDLHDELGALLTSAKLDAARIKSRLANLAADLPQAPEALARLAHLVETLNSGISLKRRIIEDLRPSALSNLGLVATLEILAREFATQSGLQVHCNVQPVPLEPDAELVVYRLVQEAINNITKHAKATEVWISMGLAPAPAAHQVEVTVKDNGVGFDTQARPGSSHGLLGMRFRVQAEGGRLDLQSVLGQGTQIRMLLPAARPGPNLPAPV
jgi:signal transduction histidine kinase